MGSVGFSQTLNVFSGCLHCCDQQDNVFFFACQVQSSLSSYVKANGLFPLLLGNNSSSSNYFSICETLPQPSALPCVRLFLCFFQSCWLSLVFRNCEMVSPSLQDTTHTPSDMSCIMRSLKYCEVEEFCVHALVPVTLHKMSSLFENLCG